MIGRTAMEVLSSVSPLLTSLLRPNVVQGLDGWHGVDDGGPPPAFSDRVLGQAAAFLA